MTTIKNLLEREPQEITDELYWLAGCYFNHFPELGNDLWIHKPLKVEGVVEKVIKEYYFDSRRVWRIGALTMDNRVVMITQNAGREGDDYSNRFILNKDLYFELVRRIKASLPIEKGEIDVVNIDDDIDGLTYFYNDDIETVHLNNYY